MGLSPVPQHLWLTERASPAQQAHKRRLLSTRPTQVCAALPDTLDWQHDSAEALQALRGLAPGPHPALALPDTVSPTLVATSMSLPADLCLLKATGERYVLAAACLFAPSYWSLGEKLGQELVAMHAPVRGLEARLGERMRSFAANLPPERPFTRRNFFVHAASEPFQPVAEEIVSDATAETLYVRSETQTLTKIATDALAFTIDVHIYPFTHIADHPDAAHDLARAIDAMDEDELDSFAHTDYRTVVTRYLRQLSKET